MDLANHTRFPTTNPPEKLFWQFCSFGAPGPTQGTERNLRKNRKLAHQQWIWQNIHDFQRRKPQTFCFGNFACLALQGPLRVLREICGKSETWPTNNGFGKTYRISNEEHPNNFVSSILLLLRSMAHSGYLEKFAENLKTGPQTIDLAKHTRFPTTKTPNILFRQFCFFGAPGLTQGT